MSEHQKDLSVACNLIELTSTQRQVIEILRTVKSQKYLLVDWYIGAIYAAQNTYNPDRFSQAAQSLRELLEKLPRVFVETEVTVLKPDFKGMSDKLYSQLCSDKERYGGEWKEKTIDPGLETTICDMERYLEANQLPTRKEQIHSLMNRLDPMHDTLDQVIREGNLKQFRELWDTFEGLSHHNGRACDKNFGKQLALVERLIIDLLAPITAQDQGDIRAIISTPHPEKDDVRKLIELIKRRGANYAFFFKTVDSPAWITPLVENGFFKNPPNVEAAEDGSIIASIWWPIFYLQRVSAQSPEQVVEIILGLGKTNNPRILREIFSIACDLANVSLSLRLSSQITQFLRSPYRWGEEELIVKILQKWGHESGPPRTAALEIVKFVISFQPDPKQDEKRSRHKENPQAWNASLEPAPRFDQWEYQQIIEQGVRPLAEKEPYQVADILIDAVASMIRLGMHPEELVKGSDEDFSEIWCLRLDKPDRDYQNVKETLVHTLNYACEQVYNKTPKSIETLDQALRKKRWKVFRRLRQHLYALHPNDQTLPWIRECILGNDDYSKREHYYEFQLMIRKACEHFGHRLLSESKQCVIFDAIRSGPSKEEFRESKGESYSDETFQQRQRYFHRMQLRPFAALLGGEVRRYFDQLEDEAEAEAVTDDCYSPYSGVSVGTVNYRSPKSAEDLERFTDEELLTYLNDWNEEHRDKDNWLVEINISALAGVFQSLFKNKIVSDSERLDFWMAHRDNIARPIYVAIMVKAMQEIVKENNFGNLDQWIEFCAWVLAHPDLKRAEGQPEPRDKSSDHPDWASSRREVVDFIGVCVNKDMDAPVAARAGIASLLQQACSQFDWKLDHNRPVLLNPDDPITEAINSTRSRSLEFLVYFGFWIRRHLPEDPVPEVTDILSKRTARDAEFPLTRPEHALLGKLFGNLCVLNRDWAIAQREALFPQGNVPVWRDAFGSYIRFNEPVKVTFEILRREFEYAIENLNVLTATKDDGRELVDRLGQHLFTYYLWQVYPLKSEESLLERFYKKTRDDHKRWAQLFDHVGRCLRKNGKHLDKSLTDRAIAYFDWRLEASEPLELQEFTFWLEAECLDSEWRLLSYSKILDCRCGKNAGFSQEVRALHKLLPDHLALVVECFAKITDAMDQSTKMYVSTNEAKLILRAGLNAEDLQVRNNAERARENLLRRGCIACLDVE
ncbi:MAG: hypothetical protein JW795_16675 [Chitinivibrionales bacterium]|nr:hypothetical protein [Chitinivibrionales bacterium]